MKFVCVFLLGAVLAFVSGDDDCPKQLKGVFDCLKKNHDSNKDADDKKIEDGKTAVTKCFTDNGCKGPDYDKNPTIGGQDVGDKLKQADQNTPPAVKDCLKKLFEQKAVDKVNQCLKAKNVKPVTDSELDGLDIKGEAGSRPDGDPRLAKAAFAVTKALKQCEKDKDAGTRDKVEKCIQPIKDAAKKEVCKRIEDCKKDTKVSDGCSKRAKEIKDALCQCKQDQFKTAKGKVEDLQKQGGDITFDQLREVMPDDLKNVDFDAVANCYTSNNTPVPLPVLLAQGAKNGGGPLGIKPTLSQAQLQNIHDHLDNEIKNPQCGAC